MPLVSANLKQNVHEYIHDLAFTQTAFPIAAILPNTLSEARLVVYISIA